MGSRKQSRRWGREQKTEQELQERAQGREQSRSPRGGGCGWRSAGLEKRRNVPAAARVGLAVAPRSIVRASAGSASTSFPARTMDEMAAELGAVSPEQAAAPVNTVEVSASPQVLEGTLALARALAAESPSPQRACVRPLCSSAPWRLPERWARAVLAARLRMRGAPAGIPL